MSYDADNHVTEYEQCPEHLRKRVMGTQVLRQCECPELHPLPHQATFPHPRLREKVQVVPWYTP